MVGLDDQTCSIHNVNMVGGGGKLNAYEGPLWIGLNKLAGRRNAWGWSDNSPFSPSWSNWKNNFPIDEEYGHLCGYQASEDTAGKWINGHCDAKKGFICKRPKTSDPTPKTTQMTPTVSGYCPAGYSGVGNKCFKVVLPGQNSEGAITFDKALSTCRQGPGFLPSLASISSELEQAYIAAHLQDLRFGIWLGLRRPYFGEDWTWVDSSSYKYKNWAPDKPQDRNGGHCAEMWMLPGSLGEWNNVNCLDKRGYVCQTYKDAGNIIPTSATPPHNFTCPTGFTPYWYGCFKYQSLPLSYERAQAECTNMHPNAKLAGIHAEAENAAVQTWAIMQNSGLWIGFNDNGDDSTGGEYKWDDGWVVFFVNWASGQPAKDDGGGCVYMSQDGKWSDANCQLQKPSVCKISQIPAITTPATVEGDCPSGDGWFEYHEHCYLIVINRNSYWSYARQECQKKGFLSTLASIHSFTENQMIYDKLKEMGGSNKNVWIGLYRSTVDRAELKWSDGTSLQYEAWAPNEPNGEEDEDDCIVMHNEKWRGQWNDQYCREYEGYVCKAPKAPHISLPTLPPHCEAGWRYWIPTGACYLFKPDDLRPREMAEEFCKEKDSHVASIHGAFENAYIEEEMKAASSLPTSGIVYYWIGLNGYIKDGSLDYAFNWTDSSEYDYENWSYDPPSSPRYYPCVQMAKTDGKWRTIQCTLSRGFVCKKHEKTTQQPKTDDNTGLSGGQVAGIVIGVLAGMMLLAFIVVAVLTQKQVIDNPITGFKSSTLFNKRHASPGLDTTINYEKQP